MLNACQARFLNPRLVYARAYGIAATEPNSNAAGPAFIQIGTEGGFLPPVYPAGRRPIRTATPRQLLWRRPSAPT